jgi:glyoxylase-like metal-dependent hydrolase (beta-lactamase superfamily II)
MHPLDAALVRRGETMRPVKAAPGLVNKIVFNLFMKRRGPMEVEPTEIEYEVQDGDELPLAGGLKVIHVPGHCAGQLAFLWPQHGGVLFVADAATNMFRLGYPPIFEDLDEGKISLTRLAGLDFEIACFGHGQAIVGGAANRFRQKWG